MRNVKDVQDLTATLEDAKVDRREILRLLFALDGGMLFETTLELCGFERAELRAHLASLHFEGYDWSFKSTERDHNSIHPRVYHLTPPPPREVVA